MQWLSINVSERSRVHVSKRDRIAILVISFKMSAKPAMKLLFSDKITKVTDLTFYTTKVWRSNERSSRSQKMQGSEE